MENFSFFAFSLRSLRDCLRRDRRVRVPAYENGGRPSSEAAAMAPSVVVGKQRSGTNESRGDRRRSPQGVVAFMEVDDVASMVFRSSCKSLAFKALVSATHSNPGRKPIRIMSCQRDRSQMKSRQTGLFLKNLDRSISIACLQMKVVIKGEEEDGHENEDDRDQESGNIRNTEIADTTEEEVDLNNVPEREEDMATKEDEEGGGGEKEEEEEDDGDGNGREFKIINVLNHIFEDEIASLKLGEFSNYGRFVEAVHDEWVKLTGGTPQPEVDIVKPWPNFDTLYCDSDGSPIDMEVKELKWEEFRKVTSCVRMFHHLVKIYLIEDNQTKKAVGEADLHPLGSYDDLARVLHFEWARYEGRNPSAKGMDIGSSWPGYRITLFGWEAPISTAMVREEFKYELCFIRVKMMDGGASGDAENTETPVRVEEEGVTIYLALPFPSPQAKQIFEVGNVYVFELASYEDLARVLHKAWAQHTGRNPSPNVVDVEKSWPGYRVTLFAQDDSGLYNHPIGITDMDWEAFSETLHSIQVEPADEMGSMDGTSGGSVGDQSEDHGENENGGRGNGGVDGE